MKKFKFMMMVSVAVVLSSASAFADDKAPPAPPANAASGAGQIVAGKEPCESKGDGKAKGGGSNTGSTPANSDSKATVGQ